MIQTLTLHIKCNILTIIDIQTPISNEENT
jgi:hypothetical protein